MSNKDLIINIMNAIFTTILIPMISTFDTSLEEFASVLSYDSYELFYKVLKSTVDPKNYEFYILVWEIIYHNNFQYNNFINLVPKLLKDRFKGASDVIMCHQRKLINFQRKCKAIDPTAINQDRSFALFKEFGAIIRLYIDVVSSSRTHVTSKAKKNENSNKDMSLVDEPTGFSKKKPRVVAQRINRGREKRIANNLAAQKSLDDAEKARKDAHIENIIELNRIRDGRQTEADKRMREEKEDAHLPFDEYVAARDWRWNDYVRWQIELRSCRQSYRDF